MTTNRTTRLCDATNAELLEELAERLDELATPSQEEWDEIKRRTSRLWQEAKLNRARG